MVIIKSSITFLLWITIYIIHSHGFMNKNNNIKSCKVSRISSSKVISADETISYNANESTNLGTNDENFLVPLSNAPLLLVSSKPLLNRDECKILREYLEITKDGAKDPLNDVFFQREGNYVFSTAHESKKVMLNEKDKKSNKNQDIIGEKARQLIYRVRRDIDKLTNSPSHPGDFALPRFLSFKVDDIPDPTEESVDTMLNALLPDGLHCDNTNNMFTRHISALLYLSDEVDEHEKEGLVGGSTTFPLALPLMCDRKDNCKVQYESLQWDEQIKDAAQRLVSKHILHTGVNSNEVDNIHDCMLLECAAYGLFHKEVVGKESIHSKSCTNDEDTPSCFLPESNLGIRVNPKAGQLCVFHNLLDDGSVDPLTFHAGEAILRRKNCFEESGQKVLLVFFKTIPTVSVDKQPDYNELAIKSAQSRKWIKETYYQQ